MLLGFISLLLIVGTSYISKICIPYGMGHTLLPCQKKNKDDEGANDPKRKLLSHAQDMLWRRALAAADETNHCGKKDTHNQDGIAHSGAIEPLLKLLESKNACLQHNAVFALYGLADNEDNVADLIRVGGVQKLQDGEFMVQPTRDCVAKTLKRLEEKIHERVLSHLLYLMRVSEKATQRRVALALAHLCSPADQKTIFVDNNGLQLLLALLKITDVKQQRDGSKALYKLAIKSSALSPVDAAPLSPTPQVYLGEQYVNNITLSDVTFLVEGKRFYAHQICLLASSDAFRAMFDGGYQEKDAKNES